MRKLIGFCFLLCFGWSLAQTVSFQEAEKSNDPRVIATFIKANPSHPQVVQLKKKLIDILNSGGYTTEIASATKSPESASTKSYGTTKGKVSSSKASSGSNRTVDLLNHLFNNDPNSKEAYVQITNNANCNITVIIRGPKSYSMTIPAKKQNYVLLEKGTYNFSSNICGANYMSTKSIQKDMMITLNK